MRIVQIVPSLAEKHGGPSKSVRALSLALARAGHEVELFATDPHAPAEGHEEQAEALRITTFRRDWPGRLCPSAGLRGALTRSRADIVHHHALWLRTLHYANQTDACRVLSPRGMMGPWAWQHRPWRKRFARRCVHPGALESTDGWHATSGDEAADIRRLGFRQPTCVAPNGVDAPTLAAIAESARHWHEACPETTRRPTAVFYSRFHQKKRVLELIDSWIRHAPSDWLLLLVGIPQDYTAEALEGYAQRESAAGRVRAFDGLGRPPPYAVASLFVLPSHTENFGLVIAEAMAFGVPVVVTDTTPWTEVSRCGLGWWVRWEDYGATLSVACAEGQDRLRERGKQARAWVLEQYSWDKSAQTLIEFYQSLLAARPSLVK